MTQYMRPSSDINTGWSCSTGTARYALIDETSASDSDYIYTNADGAYQECKLSKPFTPLASGEGVLRFRAKRDVLGGEITITPSIRCGSTVIKTGSAVSPATSYTEYTLTLSSAEMGNITNWADVRVRFLLYETSGYNGYVSWAVFEVPDQVLSADISLGCAF